MYIENLVNFYSTSGLYRYNYRLTLNEYLLLQKYMNVFSTRFKYKNLPEETKKISAFNSTLDIMFFFSPAIAFFKDKALGLQALPVCGNWKYNIVGFPTEWEVFGFNGFRKSLNENNSVIIPNDSVFSIPYIHTLISVQMLDEIENTHKQNLKRQRQPLILEIDEDEKKSASLFVKQLEDFSDTIRIRTRYRELNNKKQLSQNSLPFNSFAFDSHSEFIGDKLVTDYYVYENRIFQYYGYNNTSIEKKERLLVDEINAGNEIINAYYNDALESRKQGFERVNEMFGTNIEVEDNKKEFIRNAQNALQYPNGLKNGDRDFQAGNNGQRTDSGND